MAKIAFCGSSRWWVVTMAEEGLANPKPQKAGVVIYGVIISTQIIDA